MREVRSAEVVSILGTRLHKYVRVVKSVWEEIFPSRGGSLARGWGPPKMGTHWSMHVCGIGIELAPPSD